MKAVLRLSLALALALSIPTRPVLAQPVDQSTGASNLVTGVWESSVATPLGGAADTPLGPVNDLFTGAETLRLPVDVPPGRNGMQPQMAFLYRSQQSNGWLGVGWSLALGIDAIERSTNHGVSYSGDDFLASSGADKVRLMAIGGGEYRERTVSSFTRFRKLQGADGHPFWEVTDRFGVRSWFGQSAASRQDDPADASRVLRWALDRIEDPHGNFLTVSYEKQEGQIYPAHIRYSGHGTVLGGSEVIFTYEDRNDRPVSFEAGFPVRTERRLKSLAVRSRAGLFARYDLSYGGGYSSSTARSLLRRIDLYGRDSQARIPLLDLSYQEGGSGWRAPLPQWPNGPVPAGRTATDCIAADLDGSGTTDIACHRSGNEWTVSLFQHHSWNTGSWPGGPPHPLRESCLLGDFTGDGRADAVCDESDGNWRLFQFLGSGWTSSPWNSGPAAGRPVHQSCQVGNFNGDALTDIACHSGAGTWALGLSSGQGWKTPSSSWPGGAAPGGSIGNQCLAHDFNGDWSMDFACYRGGFGEDCGDRTTGWLDTPASRNQDHYCKEISLDCHQDGGPSTEDSGIVDWRWKIRLRVHCKKYSTSWQVSLARNGGWDTTDWNGGPGIPLPVGNSCLAGDFNGDGNADIACHVRDRLWTMGLSSGKGWSRETWDNGPQPGGAIGHMCTVGDFNGDRKADLSCYNGASNWSTGISTGQNWSTADWPNGPLGGPVSEIGVSCLPGDFNGDGKSDVACHVGGGLWNLGLASGPQPDLLSRIVNRNGGTVRIEYRPSAEYANTQLPAVVQTVSAIESDDGNGTVSRTSYAYEGGFLDLEKREFRGFNHVTIRGPAGAGGSTAVSEVWFHQGDDIGVDQNRPQEAVGFMRGRPYRTRISDGAGALLSETTIRYQVDDQPPYFNPVAERLESVCGASGCTKSRRVLLHYDEFGNVLREDHQGDTGTPEDDWSVERTFSPNRQAWILGLPSSETVYQGGLEQTGRRKLSATEFFYDGAADCSSLSTQSTPTRGKLTRASRWREGKPNVEERWAYDKFGNKTCARDGRGHTTKFVYDPSASFVLATINPMGHRKSVELFGVAGVPADRGLFGQVRSFIDSNDEITRYEYDVFGRQTRVAFPDGSWTGQAYADTGQVGSQHVRTDGSAGLSSWTYFDGFGRIILSRETGPEGKVLVDRTVYDARGAVWKNYRRHFDSDPAPVPTVFEYDSLGRPVSKVSPDGSRELTCYAPWETVTLDANGHLRRFLRDAFDRLILAQEFSGIYETCATGEGRRVINESLRRAVQSAAGIQIEAMSRPYASLSYRYDALGRMIEAVDPQGHRTMITYDSLGHRQQISDPDMGTWTFTYDANGNLVEQTDAKGQVVQMAYDPLNRLVRKDFGRQPTDRTWDVVYNYDEPVPHGVGRLTSARNAVATVQFRYDALGRIERTEKTVGAVTYASTLGYDAAGRVSTLTYPDGHQIRYAYDGPFLKRVLDHSTTYAEFSAFDAFGRPAIRELGNGAVARFTYWTPGNPQCPADHDRLCTVEVEDAGGAQVLRLRYTYDHEGNVIEVESPGSRQRYRYDEFHRLIGTQGMFGFDGVLERLLRAGAMSWRDLLLESVRRDGVMALQDLERLERSGGSPALCLLGGDGPGNCPVLDLPADRAETARRMLRRLEETAWLRRSEILARALAASGVSQPDLLALLLRSEQTRGAVETRLQEGALVKFERGALSQLFGLPPARFEALHKALAADLAKVGIQELRVAHPLVEFTYDRLGNLTYSSLIGDYAYPGRRTHGGVSPHAADKIGGRPYGYDDNGNVESGADRRFSYDPENRVISVALKGVETTYGYGPSGERVSRSTAGQTTVFLDDLYDCTAGKCAKHLFAGPRLLATLPSDRTAHYYHEDFLGSVAAITDGAGRLHSKLSYLPFGETVPESPAQAETAFRFTGQEFDARTGLYRMGARLYDPEIGRFLAPDSVVSLPTQTASFNRYSYVHNNPITLRDPSGQSPALSVDEPSVLDRETRQEINDFFGGLRDRWGGGEPDGHEFRDSEGLRTPELGESYLRSSRERASQGVTLDPGRRWSLGEIVGGRLRDWSPDLPPGHHIMTNVFAAELRKFNLLWFTNVVRPTGVFDYKQQGRQFEDAGNFNYGAMAAALGLSLEVALRGAGAVQFCCGASSPEFGVPWGDSPYGDDPHDQMMIIRGYEFYERGQHLILEPGVVPPSPVPYSGLP